MTVLACACLMCSYCTTKNNKLVCELYPDGIPEEVKYRDITGLKKCARKIKRKDKWTLSKCKTE